MNTAQAPLVILWDIDGTLIDSAGSGGGALCQALGELFNVPDVQSVALHGRTDRGILSELLQVNGVDANEENLRQLSVAYFAKLPDVLNVRGGRVLPGIVELLIAFQTAGCRQGVLTGNMPTSALLKLSHYNLLHCFAAGAFGDKVMHRKELRTPALQVAGWIARATDAELELGLVNTLQHSFEDVDSESVDAGRVVVIGDTPLDVQLAQLMGARCIAVTTGGCTSAQLEESGADWILPDLTNSAEIVAWCVDN